MRVAALIVSVTLSTVLLTAGAVVLALNARAGFGWSTILAAAASSIFIGGPLLLGSLAAFWDVRGSERSRRLYRIWLVVVVAAEALAAVGIIVWAVTNEASPLIPVIFIVVAAALTLVAPPIGSALQRQEARQPAATNCDTIPPAQIRSRIIAVVATFVGVSTVGLLGLPVLNGGFGAPEVWPTMALLALQLACIVSALVAMLSSLKWNRQLRDSVGRDFGRQRMIAKAVNGKSSPDLGGADLVAAVRYASVLPIVLSFQTAGYVLLYAGLILQFLGLSIRDPDSPFNLVLLAALVVLLVVLVPLLLRQIIRARRFARAHADEVRDPVES